MKKKKVSKPRYAKFGCNVPLKMPRYTRTTNIYQAVNKRFSAGGGDFIPTWDSTDHFHFCCGRCACMADVLQVRFYPNYSADAKGTKLYALFIFLGCPKCGLTGFRKIYLRPTSIIGQKTLTGDNKIYFFTVEKEATEITQLKEA